MVNEHVQSHVIHEVIVTPTHGKRDTTAFKHSVNRLKDDGHYKCFVSGKTDHLQVHHICEFSLENCVDFAKLKDFLLKFDPYGYSKLLINTDITSIDDPRNLLTLNQEFHTGVDHENGNSGIGIHELSFPAWVIQVVCKDGFSPIAKKGEDIKTVLEREESL